MCGIQGLWSGSKHAWCLGYLQTSWKQSHKQGASLGTQSQWASAPACVALSGVPGGRLTCPSLILRLKNSLPTMWLLKIFFFVGTLQSQQGPWTLTLMTLFILVDLFAQLSLWEPWLSWLYQDHLERLYQWQTPEFFLGGYNYMSIRWKPWNVYF